jgi:ferredoxin/flavodoxin---NADP+ reductase
MNSLQKTQITGNKFLGNGTYLLSFPRQFSFIAGQSIGITTKTDLSPRLYSLASGEQEQQASILYKVVTDGLLTTQLAKLGAGDTIYFQNPCGDFRSGRPPAVWIATGTGIAPFLSMLKSGKENPSLFLHGASQSEELWFRSFFEERLGMRYQPCVTKQEVKNGFQGRVTDWLEAQSSFNPDIRYYLCGRAEMVVDARDILIQKGVQFTNIFSEIYF